MIKILRGNDYSIRIVQYLIMLLSLLFLALMSASISAQPNSRQIQLLSNNCLQCHTNPDTNAPQMGNEDDWKEVIKKGQEQMLINTIVGMQGMPPLGYCSACTEQDFKILIELMSGTSFKSEATK